MSALDKIQPNSDGLYTRADLEAAYKIGLGGQHRPLGYIYADDYERICDHESTCTLYSLRTAKTRNELGKRLAMADPGWVFISRYAVDT